MHKLFTILLCVVCCAATTYTEHSDLRENADYKYILSELVKGVKRYMASLQMPILSKRPFSDVGYGSRVTAGKTVADDKWIKEGLFGSSGPGKRSLESTEPENFISAFIEERPNLSKRPINDVGYGSRVSAGKDVAIDEAIKEGLFGIHGPGKRSSERTESDNNISAYSDDVQMSDLAKRPFSDVGYGSRVSAGTDVAIDKAIKEGLFGIHGPGKRSSEFSESDMSKRSISDIGYGSRVSAGKNVAIDKAIKEGLFGIHGPGKRSLELSEPDNYVSVYSEDVQMPDLAKRPFSDVGYGSRVSAGTDVAIDKAIKEGLFGIHGPGKRSSEFSELDMSKRSISDIGYGSRVSAGKVVAIDNAIKEGLFGIHGPGRRR